MSTIIEVSKVNKRLMSFKSSKSFRDMKQTAPYRKPVELVTNRKYSLFSKVKDLINKRLISNGDKSKEGNDMGDEQSHLKKRAVSAAVVPGGFFEPDTSSSSIISLNKHKHTSHRHKKNRHHTNSASHMNRSYRSINGQTDNDDISQEENEGEEDLSTASINSNAKLANFFSKKGDKPLTDIEMEGVMSLMKKAKNYNESISNESMNLTNDENNTNDSIIINKHRFQTPNNILKNSRVSSVSSNTSFKLPTFNPKYDNSIISTSSHSRRVSSTRRVFDYSGMPSPYKTVVFRYTSATRPKETAENISHRNLSTSSVKQNHISKPPSQKMSNVASALVTLLDSKGSSSGDNGVPSSVLANPYSAHVSQLRNHKNNNLVEPKILADANHKEKTKEKKEKVEEKEEIINNEDVVLEDTKDILVEKEKEQETPKQNNTGFQLYKPNRSSSLRSSVVVADDIPAQLNKESNDAVKNPEVPKDKPSASLPSSSFNFKFSAPNISKDEGHDEKITEKKELTTKKTPLCQVPEAISQTEATTTPAIFSFGNTSIGIKKDIAKESKQEEAQKLASIPAFKFSTDTTITTKATQGTSVAYGKKEPEKFNFNIKKSEIHYIFEVPQNSGIDPTCIDNNKVESYKSQFVF